VLKNTAPMCRTLADLEVLRECLEGTAFLSDLDHFPRLGQHLQLLHVAQGQGVPCRPGQHLLLRGVCAACGGEPSAPLRCSEAWYCEDHVWPLDMDENVVAVEEEGCDLIFLPRAECGVSAASPAWPRVASLLALKSREEAVLPRAALLCDSPLLEAQEEHWAQERSRRALLVSVPSQASRRSSDEAGAPGRELSGRELSGRELSLPPGSAVSRRGSSTSFRSGGLNDDVFGPLSSESIQENWMPEAYTAAMEWSEAMLRRMLPGVGGELRP
ncbi:unnamed protein product, partial [Effrenium voratum]